MSSAQGQRIQASCEVIWGKGDYDLDVETDDWVNYAAIVRKVFGDSLGPPLTMTGLCNSSDQAWDELDRMLRVWAKQVQSGKPITKDQTLEIFGGPKGQSKAVLEQLWLLEKR